MTILRTVRSKRECIELVRGDGLAIWNWASSGTTAGRERGEQQKFTASQPASKIGQANRAFTDGIRLILDSAIPRLILVHSLLVSSPLAHLAWIS